MKDDILSTQKSVTYLEAFHSRMTVEESCLGKLKRSGLLKDLLHQLCLLQVTQEIFLGF